MTVHSHFCDGTPHGCGGYTLAWRGNWQHNIYCTLDCGHEGPHKGNFEWRDG